MTDLAISRRALVAGTGAAAFAAPAFIGKAIAQGEVTWRVQAHWPKASASFDDSLGVLAKQLEERTDGRFRMETFGAGEFAKGPEIFDIIRRGLVQMGSNSGSYLTDWSPVASFGYGIPGTLRDFWEQTHYQKNLGTEDLISSDLEKEGVIYKTEKSFPSELVISREVKNADDFRALKLRASGVMLDYLSSSGASASFIPGSELYQALSSGVVDGATWGGAVGAQTMSLWEVCKHHMKPSLAMTSDCWLISMDALEALPDDLRMQFMALVEERYYARTAEYQLLETLALNEGVEKQGVTVTQFPDDVLALFAEASSRIIDQEAQKSEKAAQAADALRHFMSQLGYV